MLLSGRRILIVEDQFLVALHTADVLEGLGCEIVGPAPRVGEALDLARTEMLDAAILDINLAGEMVWPVAAELKSKNVPFLFLSAYSQDFKMPLTFSNIVRLEKPLNDVLLRRALATMLEFREKPFSELNI